MQKLIFSFLLVILGAVVFAGTRDLGFVWRDTPTLASSSVPNGPNADAGSHGWVEAWKPTTDTAYEPVAPTVRGLVSRLATSPEAEPRTMHILNTATHLVGSVFVFLILAMILQNQGAAFIGALLFAVHPLQVDPVAYVSSFKFVLGTTLALFAVWQFLIFATQQSSRNPKRSHRHYYAATAAFVLALLCDANTLVTPAIAAVCVKLLPERSAFANHKVPAWRLALWFLLAVPAGLWLIASQNTHALSSQLPFWTKPLAAGDAIAFYLSKLLVPFHMGPDYGRSPSYLMSHWWGYATWLVTAVLLVLLASWRAKASHWYRTALLLLVLGLLPFLGLFYFEDQATSTVANRYAYFAMLGPALAAAYTVSMPRKSWFPALVVAAVFACGYKSRLDVGHWQDDETLWRHALAVNPTSPIAHQSLGDAARKAGDWENARMHYHKVLESNALSSDINFYLGEIERLHGDKDKAVAFYEKTLALDPTFAQAHVRLGLAYLQAGRDDLALEHLNKAVALAPKSEEPLRNLGYLYAKRKDYPNAITYLTKALSLGTHGGAAAEADTHALLGTALAQSGQAEAAQSHLEKALALNPDHGGANRALADIYFAKGQLASARPLYEKAAAQGAQDFPLFDHLAAALADNKEHARAVSFYAKALELKPDAAETLSHLGISQFRLRQFKEATASFTRALELNPNQADPHYFLGDIARWQGKEPESLAQYQRALRIQPDHPDANYRMGNHMMKEGKAAAAARYYQAALRGSPNDVKLQYSLQKAQKSHEGPSDAVGM